MTSWFTTIAGDYLGQLNSGSQPAGSPEAISFQDRRKDTYPALTVHQIRRGRRRPSVTSARCSPSLSWISRNEIPFDPPTEQEGERRLRQCHIAAPPDVRKAFFVLRQSVLVEVKSPIIRSVSSRLQDWFHPRSCPMRSKASVGPPGDESYRYFYQA